MAPTNTGFCKNEECPSSTELLDYENGNVGKPRGSEIRRHLSACEFCEAEAAFYSTYPQAAEENAAEPAPTEIPGPLFELAEALLRNRHSDGASLNSLLKQRRRRAPARTRVS
jgi:hypothetical protein